MLFWYPVNLLLQGFTGYFILHVKNHEKRRKQLTSSDKYYILLINIFIN